MDLNAIGCVILAAGLSRRMGEAKLLLPWGEKSVLGTTLDQVQAVGLSHLLLVSGAYREAVEELATQRGIPVRYNPIYASGEMLSSLKVGVTYFADLPVDGLLVFLGDLPLIQRRTVRELIAAWERERPLLAAPTYQRKQGHPTLISRLLWPELLALPVDARPRDLFKNHAAEVLHLPVGDRGILIDIDTPEAYTRWRPQ